MCADACMHAPHGIVLQYADRQSLQHVIHEGVEAGSKFSEPNARNFAWQFVRGMRHLHSLNIIHRDIKPHNLFIDSNLQGESELLKIGDFGLAKTLKTSNPRELDAYFFIGTVPFAAPEMLARKPRYDIKKAELWAVGATLCAQSSLPLLK